MTMTRKEFLRTLVGVGAGAAAIATVAGCGGDDGGPADAPGGSCTTPSANIGSNHGHTMTVSLADVQAGAAKMYDITGSGGHAHSVMVSAANFTTLSTGGTVTLTSTSGSAHTHTVTVTCV